jgi:hypothetical protein
MENICLPIYDSTLFHTANLLGLALLIQVTIQESRKSVFGVRRMVRWGDFLFIRVPLVIILFANIGARCTSAWTGLFPFELFGL